jgi:DNA-binding IclR family transcriptional regulator
MKNEDQGVGRLAGGAEKHASGNTTRHTAHPVSSQASESMATKRGPVRARTGANIHDGAPVSRYRAPALEKGLDVLELLAAEKVPLNLSAVSQRLGRSSGELFRMLQVLEFKGFITTSENGAGYVLTNKLFALAMAQAPVRSLVETALPVMRKLTLEIGQSCHIAVASEDQIVVITRIERPGDLGFSVRIGYRREIARAASGLVLFAYQDDQVRNVWLKRCRLKGQAAEAFVERANRVRERGYHEADSDFVRGIVDLSAPILRGETAVAALTCPFVHSHPLVMDMEQAVEAIRAAARQISTEFVHGDLP